MLYSGIASGIPFLERLFLEFGHNQRYFTGDGGDKLIPRLRPTTLISSNEALLKFVVARESVCELTSACRIFGLDPCDLQHEVASVLGMYPESDHADRFTHFLICERAINWSFEGEDHNRYFFWSCSPFYSSHFFRAAMSFPASRKSRHRLYHSFLQLLDPRMTSIVDASRGSAMNSRAYGLKMLGPSLLQHTPRLMSYLKRLLRRPGTAMSSIPAIREVLHYLHKKGGPASEALDLELFLMELERESSWNWVTQHNVLTIALSAELHTDASLDLDGLANLAL